MDSFVFFVSVWQREVDERAYDATMLPRSLQVLLFDNRTDVPFSLVSTHIALLTNFLNFFQDMCHYTDYE